MKEHLEKGGEVPKLYKPQNGIDSAEFRWHVMAEYFSDTQLEADEPFYFHIYDLDTDVDCDFGDIVCKTMEEVVMKLAVNGVVKEEVYILAPNLTEKWRKKFLELMK